MTALCIPAEADRWQSGWHVVWMLGTQPSLRRWISSIQAWEGDLSPEQAAGIGYRYGGPAPEAKESEG